jgi:hypothetical protein
MIQMPVTTRSNLDVKLYNLQGVYIANLRASKKMDNVVTVDLPNTLIFSGLKIVTISDGVKSWSKQLLIL